MEDQSCDWLYSNMVNDSVKFCDSTVVHSLCQHYGGQCPLFEVTFMLCKRRFGIFKLT